MILLVNNFRALTLDKELRNAESGKNANFREEPRAKTKRSYLRSYTYGWYGMD